MQPAARRMLPALLAARLLPAALLLLAGIPLLAGCAAAPPPAPPSLPWQEASGAVLTLHRGGVPHSDRLGLLRQSLDPARSLLPLVLDNAMVDYQRGPRFGFAAAAEAGFNAVAPWSEQPRAAILEAAAGSRLLAVMPARQPAADDDANGTDIEWDNSAWFDPAGIRLARAIPFRGAPDQAARPADLRLGSDGPEASLAAIAAAVAEEAAAAQPRPVWAVLQAFAAAGPPARRLPSPAEARALAYGALVLGASGLVWFAEDSYAGRSNGALGIAPAPALDYGIRLQNGAATPAGGPAWQPGPRQIAAAAGLWQVVAQLNREIERLSPALLSPDARFDSRVRLLALDGGAADLATDLAVRGPPLRLLLKRFDDRYILVAVNLTPRPWRLFFGLPHPLSRIERWFDPAPPPPLSEGGSSFEEDFPPHAVRVYRLSP